MSSGDGGLLQRYVRGLKPLSLIYFTAFFLVGCALASIGPTMILLADNTNSTTAQVAMLFPARSCAYLAGAAIGGPMFDRLPGNTILGASMILCGVGMLLVPAVHNLILLALAISTSGLAMGVLDTGGNVLLIRLHGAEVSAYMQTMHFLFGAGAFACPLLVAAFVAADPTQGLAWSFGSVGLLCLPCGIALLRSASPAHRPSSDGIQLRETESCPESEREFSKDEEEEEAGGPGMAPGDEALQGRERGAEGAQPSSGDPARPMVAAGALLLLLYVGSEVSYGGYIFVYAVQFMGFSEHSGYLLNAAFWGALAMGRLVAIPWSMVSKSASILAVDLVGCLAALAVLLWWQSSAAVLWAMTAVFGLLMGPVFPTVMTFAEECTPISSRQTAVLVVGAASGEMLLPALLSLLFASPGPDPDAALGWLMWVLAADALLSLAVFGVLVQAGRGLRQGTEETEGLVANAA